MTETRARHWTEWAKECKKLEEQLTEKDKQIEELKDDNKACKFAMAMSEKAEKAKDKKIAELEAQIEELKNKVDDLAKMCNTTNERFVKEVDKTEELEAQIEKMKCCANCWKYYRGKTADDKDYLCEHHEFNDKCKLWELEE